jgi:hypothetical protein
VSPVRYELGSYIPEDDILQLKTSRERLFRLPIPSECDTASLTFVPINACKEAETLQSIITHADFKGYSLVGWDIARHFGETLRPSIQDRKRGSNMRGPSYPTNVRCDCTVPLRRSKSVSESPLQWAVEMREASSQTRDSGYRPGGSEGRERTEMYLI